MRRAALALLVLLALLSPAALATWPMDGVDARRSNTAKVAIPTSNVELVWNGTGQYTTILVAEDGSVVGIGDPVTVWEKDGTVRWSNRTVGPQQQVYRARAGALLSDGTIVTSGSLPFGAPAIVIYDPDTGAQTTFDRNLTGSCDSLDESPIAVGSDDSFYIGSCGPGIMAFTKDGARKWNVSAEADRVALGGTNLYTEVEDHKLANGTTYEDALLALSQTDGSVLWVAKLEDGGNDPFVGADGTVYILDAGYVTALSPADGSVKWRTIVPRPFALGIAPNGTIAAASSSVMSWISPADGRVLGSSPTKDGKTVILGDDVHLRAYGNGLAAVDKGGATLWEVTSASRTFQSNVALAEGGWIFVAEDGRMNAYRGEGGSAPTTSTPTLETPTGSPSPIPTLTGVASEAPADASGTPAPAAILVALVVVAVALLRRPS